MRVLITGASGFIGSALVKEFSKQGHEVVALCRSGQVAGWNGRCIKWHLGSSVPEGLASIDCAVHLAHDFNGAAGAKLTVESTVTLARELEAMGIRRQLYFSSYSAGPHATSLYGITKLLIEKSLAEFGVIILRPGLVLGEGGIYGRIRRVARIAPFIPLPDGGYGGVPVISIEKLCGETVSLAEAEQPGLEVNVFERQTLRLRELVLSAAAEVGRRPLVIPVPSRFLLLLLRLSNALHIPLPVKADNLEGFLSNQNASHKSSFKDRAE